MLISFTSCGQSNTVIPATPQTTSSTTGTSPIPLTPTAATRTGATAYYFADAQATQPLLAASEQKPFASWKDSVLARAAHPALVRWQGQLLVDAGTYTFTTTSKALKVWVNGTLVVSPEQSTGIITLTSAHPLIRIELASPTEFTSLPLTWQATGTATQAFDFAALGTPTFSAASRGTGQLTAQMFGQQLLPEPGFEANGAAWFGSNYSIVTPGRDGTGHALSIGANDPYYMPVSTYALPPITQGATYTLELWGKAAGGASCIATLGLGYALPAGQTASVSFTSTTWEKKTITLTHPYSSRAFSLNLSRDRSTGGECQFDDVAVTQVTDAPVLPTPAGTLVQNGEFETNSDQWTPYSGSGLAGTVTPKGWNDSAGALEFPTGYTTVRQIIPAAQLKPNTAYVATYYGSAGSSDCSFELYSLTPDNRVDQYFRDYPSPSDGSGWQGKAFKFTTSSQPNDYVVSMTGQPGYNGPNCRFDHVLLGEDRGLGLGAITPATGVVVGGNQVTLQGSGFTGTTAVNFGTTTITDFKLIDDGHITVTVPAVSAAQTVNVSVQRGTLQSNALTYQYSAPYHVDVLARPLNWQITQYIDDRFQVLLNDQVIADHPGENLYPGTYPPLALADFAAKPGDKLTFITTNRWPWACGVGEVRVTTPDGQIHSAYPGFVDTNCNDRIGEMARYEYILPNGPGRSVPILAPDITKVDITPGTTTIPTTFNWTLSNPKGVPLSCYVDFGDGTSQIINPCNISDSIQHVYSYGGNFTAKFKVADGPYASGDPYDSRSGDSNSMQRFYAVSITGQTVNQPPTLAQFAVNPVSGATTPTFTMSWTTADPENDAVACAIDFGDGTNQTISTCTGPQSLTHTYPKEGLYTLTVKATDAKGATSVKSSLLTISSTSSGAVIPPAISNFKVTTAGAGSLSNFTWTSTGDPNRTLTCQIDFGDNQTQTIQNCVGDKTFSHVYASNGTYGAKLTVTDDKGNQVQQNLMVRLAPVFPPVIDNLKVSPDAPVVGQPTTISWSASDPQGLPISCTVDFGDGTNQEIQDCRGEKQINHTYVQGGNVTLAVKIRSQSSKTNMNSLSLSVIKNKVAPKIDIFSATPASVNLGQQIIYRWNISANEGDSVPCELDLGFAQDASDRLNISDCTKETFISKNYPKPGIYVATLKLNDGSVKSQRVEVLPDSSKFTDISFNDPSVASVWQKVANLKGVAKYNYAYDSRSAKAFVSGEYIVTVATAPANSAFDDNSSNYITTITTSYHSDIINSFSLAYYKDDDRLQITENISGRSTYIDGYGELYASSNISERQRLMHLALTKIVTNPITNYFDLKMYGTGLRTMTISALGTPDYTPCRDCSALRAEADSLRAGVVDGSMVAMISFADALVGLYLTPLLTVTTAGVVGVLGVSVGVVGIVAMVAPTMQYLEADAKHQECVSRGLNQMKVGEDEEIARSNPVNFLVTKKIYLRDFFYNTLIAEFNVAPWSSIDKRIDESYKSTAVELFVGYSGANVISSRVENGYILATWINGDPGLPTCQN